MRAAPFPQEAIASLQAHGDPIAEEATRRMRAGIPHYYDIPWDRLCAQNRRTLDQIARMMDESNFPVAREYFEKLTAIRARAGIPVDDFLRATEIMMGVVEEHIEQAFADDPAYRDRALRLLRAGTVFTRNIIGRRHLQDIVQQTKPTPSSE